VKANAGHRSALDACHSRSWSCLMRRRPATRGRRAQQVAGPHSVNMKGRRSVLSECDTHRRVTNGSLHVDWMSVLEEWDTGTHGIRVCPRCVRVCDASRLPPPSSGLARPFVGRVTWSRRRLPVQAAGFTHVVIAFRMHVCVSMLNDAIDVDMTRSLHLAYIRRAPGPDARCRRIEPSPSTFQCVYRQHKVITA